MDKVFALIDDVSGSADRNSPKNDKKKKLGFIGNFVDKEFGE